MRDSILPPEWAIADIGDFLVAMVGGASPTVGDYSTEGVLTLNKGDIKQRGMVILKPIPNRVPTSYAKLNATKIIQKGATLVTLRDLSTKADFLGLISKYNSEEQALITQGMYALHTHEDCSSSYLIHYSNAPKYRSVVKNVKVGATQVHLRNEQFKEIEIPFPPLAEQKQIAAKLDELLAQVDTIKTRLEAIPHILKRFRQSVLSAAVSGKLTEEWRIHATISESAKELKQRWLLERKIRFEKIHAKQALNLKIKQKKQFAFPCGPDLETRAFEAPSEWEIVSIAEFADCLDSKRIPVKKDSRQTAQGLYPYFGANGEVDRVDQYIFDGDYVLVTEDETFYGRTKPIAYRFTGKCWVNNHAHILSAPTKDANDYLCFALMYFDVIPWLSGTTGRAKLTQAALNSLPIGLPSEAEQTEIVRRVEQLFAFADQIEQRVKDAQSRVNHLTQSILAKAFRGELTADWRAQNPDLITGENSAEALLARIRTEREANTGTTKPRKRKAST